MVDAGAVVIKFWLQISANEQLRRFKERQDTEFKRFKITEEDWRNREKWDDYVTADPDPNLRPCLQSAFTHFRLNLLPCMIRPSRALASAQRVKHTE